MPSFVEAVRLGVDVIEFDVLTTLDGVVICHHDPLIEETGMEGRDIFFSVGKGDKTTHVTDDKRTRSHARIQNRHAAASVAYLILCCCRSSIIHTGDCPGVMVLRLTARPYTASTAALRADICNSNLLPSLVCKHWGSACF